MTVLNFEHLVSKGRFSAVSNPSNSTVYVALLPPGAVFG
jgi:hypothetical protein